MKAKIVLIDGVVVEADGTAQEIADLTESLRRSHQLAQSGSDKPQALIRTIPPVEPGPIGTSEYIGPGEVDVLEPLDEVDEPDPGDSEIEEDEDLAPKGTENEPEVVGGSCWGSSRPTGPPLDLVVREVAGQFRLLADPTRLQILNLLSDRGHNVGVICERLGGQSQPAVSHHLALLRVSGLVTPSREGKFIHYDLTDQGRTLTEAVGRFGTPEGSRASALFRQASDTTRLQILVTLSEGDRNVGELCSDLGGMSQPAVSHHLALLRHGGLIEARRAGKFSYYSLREEGRELTRLVVPMMAAKSRAGASDGTGGDTFEAEAIDFSVIADDWMIATPSTDFDPGDSEPTGPNGAPPAHLLCRRVLLMVQELHRRGYERLRVAPGLSPSGLHWRCSVLPVRHVRRDHGAMVMDEDGPIARYSSGQGAKFFDWVDAELDPPVALASKFLQRFPELAAQGRGSDPDYIRWYTGMLRATDPDGLIYAYADWELPGDHLPALGCMADVKIPFPPPGEAPLGDEDPERSHGQ
jgi:DNA-binding transcriptional ArsR family regulator